MNIPPPATCSHTFTCNICLSNVGRVEFGTDVENLELVDADEDVDPEQDRLEEAHEDQLQRRGLAEYAACGSLIDPAV